MGRSGIGLAVAFSMLLAVNATARAEVTEGSSNVPPVSEQPM